MTTLIFIVLLGTAIIAIGCFARLAEIKDEVQRTNEHLNGCNYTLKGLRDEHREYRTKVLGAVSNLDNNLRQTREDMNQGTAAIIQRFSDITAEPAPQDPAEQPKLKVRYAGKIYDVIRIKELSCGKTMYGILDEPNHIDYINKDSCEIVSEQPSEETEPAPIENPTPEEPE